MRGPDQMMKKYGGSTVVMGVPLAVRSKASPNKQNDPGSRPGPGQAWMVWRCLPDSRPRSQRPTT